MYHFGCCWLALKILHAHGIITGGFLVILFLLQVMLPMCVLTSLSIICATIEGDTNPSNRLGSMMSLSLTAVAYTFVAGNGLPVLSYLTFLDRFVLCCFGFLVGMIGLNYRSTKFDRGDEEVRGTSDSLDLSTQDRGTARMCFVLPFEVA